MELNVFTLLLEAGCCSRCCLRFLGWRKSKCYDDPLQFAEQMGYLQKTDTKCFRNEQPCAICLDVLQNDVHDVIAEKVKNKFQEENYDSAAFVCALNIPNSIRLRERSMHVYIAKKLDLSSDQTCSLKAKLQNVKDISKWLLLPKIECAIDKQAEAIDSHFLIEITLTYAGDESECRDLEKEWKRSYVKSNSRKRKHDGRLGKKHIELSIAVMPDEDFTRCFPVPPPKPVSSVSVKNITFSHGGMFIGGRYTKFSRKLSQTPWFINGEKKMESSVQDMICVSIMELFKPKSVKFLSSGREDVDVRNIHGGRPFAVELIDPRITKATDEDLSKLVVKINDSTDQVKVVSELKIFSKLDMKKLKEGEDVKKKFYRALCLARADDKDALGLENLNDLRNLTIVQKTPIRVLHRRPLSPRVRCIYEMRARWVTSSELERLPSIEPGAVFFVIDVKTQAGTYVKEFVHGDFGRTRPSLRDLLHCDVDIVALDVTGVDLNWP